MAILKGIEVSVVIDGKALTEYDDEETADESPDHPSEVSKYIEAISDAEFSINIKAPKSYDFVRNALCFLLRLDGVQAAHFVCSKTEHERMRGDWHQTILGSKVNNGKGWYLKPFKFSDIKLGKTSLHILTFCVD